MQWNLVAFEHSQAKGKIKEEEIVQMLPDHHKESEKKYKN